MPRTTFQNASKTKMAKDATTEQVISDFRTRVKVGLAEYGKTLTQADLPLLTLLEYAYEESLDYPIYLKAAINKEREKLGLLEKPGENTQTTPPSNASQIPLSEIADLPSLIYLSTCPEAMDEKEFRAFWRSVLSRGGNLYASMLKNVIETWQGVEAMKPDGDPVEKLRVIKEVSNANPGLLEDVFKICGHGKVKFVEVTDASLFERSNEKAGTGELENKKAQH